MGGGLTKDTPPEVKAAAVKERSNARWEALIKGDKDAAYAYLSPGTRELITLEQYRGRMQTGSFRSVQIEKVDCDDGNLHGGIDAHLRLPAVEGSHAGEGDYDVRTGNVGVGKGSGVVRLAPIGQGSCKISTVFRPRLRGGT